jgi:hypothetical protein
MEFHMLRALVLALVLYPVAAVAQTAPGSPADGMTQQMMQMHQMMMDGGPMVGQGPTEAGQSAFAAIQEIVAILEADPKTDWSKVNIDALREHLADMDAVTLHAQVDTTPIANGSRFTVTGDGPVKVSIQRMVTAHAATMNGVNGWQFQAITIDSGAMMSVTAPQADQAKLKGLGFFGILTLGMHHQQHHLMIARGGHPHS